MVVVRMVSWSMKWVVNFSLLCLLVVGCQSLRERRERMREWMEQSSAIKVLCTTEHVGALVRFVGGDAVDVLVLIDGSNDPHSYQLVKGDNEKFRRADVIFSSGAGLEQGSSCARSLSLYHATSVGEGILGITRNAITIGPTVDPHLWMDLSLWACGAYVVANRLSQVRPELSAYFEQNATSAFRRLLSLHEGIRALLHTVPSDRRYLVTTHDAFSYFSRAYLAEHKEQCTGEWRERNMAPEGCSPESQISTHDLEAVVSYIIRHHVRTIFIEPGMNEDSLRKVVDVCRSRGYDVEISKDSLHSDTIDGTYEETMEHMARIIYRSLMEVKDL